MPMSRKVPNLKLSHYFDEAKKQKFIDDLFVGLKEYGFILTHFQDTFLQVGDVENVWPAGALLQGSSLFFNILSDNTNWSSTTTSGIIAGRP